MSALRKKFPEHILASSGCGSLSLFHKDIFNNSRRPCSYTIVPYKSLSRTVQGAPNVSPSLIILDVPINQWDGPLMVYRADESRTCFQNKRDYTASHLEQIASHAPSAQQINSRNENGSYFGCLFPLLAPLAAAGAIFTYMCITK